MHPLLASLPRPSASRRMSWDRGGRVRGRSPPAVATAWLGRCPSTPCAIFRSRGIHTDLQGPAGGSDQYSFEHGSFHPPDRCAPSFLTRSDSRRPTLACRTASHGVVKVRPSVVYNRGVNSAASARHRARATGPGLPRPTAFRPCGFSPPRRFTPPRPFRDVAPDSDHGVRRVSTCCETGFLATRSCPSEPCSPMAAAMRNRSPVPRAIVTGARRCRRATVHRSPCPLVVVPSSCLRMLPVATARPCSTTGAVADVRVAAPIRPLLSWDCPSPMPTCAAPDVATGRAPVARDTS